MLETIGIICYFTVLLMGLLLGLYIGLSFRQFCVNKKEWKWHKKNIKQLKKKRPELKKKERKKNSRQKKLEKRKVKKFSHSKGLLKILISKIKKLQKRSQANILTERIPEYESYMEFICDSMGEDNCSERIKKFQHTQDEKYTIFTKK